jgi:trehalose 6-phosphate phosphatase
VPELLTPLPGLPGELHAHGRACALFLDFDGTLVDIAERPDAISVAPELPDILAQLRQQLGGALALVSGRPIAFLDACFAPIRFDAAGLHGLEHRISGRLTSCRPEDHPGLRAAVERLQGLLAPYPGVLIEDKGCSVAIHWRLAPARAELAQGTAQAIAESLGPDYRIQYGKAVAEIIPTASGKGWVIESFLAQPPYRGRTPVFIGDDLTDEHGFETVTARGGLSVRVGQGATVARARLETPADVRRCLAAWTARGESELGEV